MVKLSTKVSFEISVARKPQASKETTQTISKVLKAAKETIRTRLRKIT